RGDRAGPRRGDRDRALLQARARGARGAARHGRLARPSGVRRPRRPDAALARRALSRTPAGRRDRSEAMTHRLYHDDAYLRRFDAEVVAITTCKARPAVVLDRTAFYPEAGGQLGDRGRLGELAVVDTQETDDGTIVHLVESQVEGELPAVGSRVTGEL